jgi:hypothetical protein
MELMEIEQRMDMRRQIKDAEWDAQYQARMRVLNAQRKVGVNGKIILKRERTVQYGKA